MITMTPIPTLPFAIGDAEPAPWTLDPEPKPRIALAAVEDLKDALAARPDAPEGAEVLHVGVDDVRVSLAGTLVRISLAALAAHGPDRILDAVKDALEGRAPRTDWRGVGGPGPKTLAAYPSLVFSDGDRIKLSFLHDLAGIPEDPPIPSPGYAYRGLPASADGRGK